MMTRYCFILLFAALGFPLMSFGGGKNQYAFDLIDKKLLVNANAVTRIYDVDVTVESPQSVVVKEHYVVTVLNKEGSDYAAWAEAFSRTYQIEKLNACLYDAEGKQLRKMKESDFSVQAHSLAAADYTDSKLKVYSESYAKYPYTFEVISVTRYNHSFTLPEWVAKKGNDCAVETASLYIRTSNAFPIRYRIYNTQLEPQVSQQGNEKVYSWQVSNLLAEQEEYMTSVPFGGSPVVMTAPLNFQLETYSGQMTDWKSMGKFIYELNKGRDVLPEERKKAVREIAAGSTDTLDMVRRLYQYMQQHTRYVSIQYGIGGWQTIDAAFTSGNQYGDCKALSNYMMAMLKEVGITSYPVIIYAGRNTDFKTPEDFPSQSFNHIILSVPMHKDTIWLECTSSEQPFDFLGSFTDDRYGLMITPSGGGLVRTPRYDTADNIVSHLAAGQCNSDGGMVIKMRNRYLGLMTESFTRMKSLNAQEKDRFVNNKFNLGSYSVSGYATKEETAGGLPGVIEEVEIHAGNMVSKSSNYKLLSMDLAPLSLSVEAQAAERKTGFRLPYSYTVIDSFEVGVPDGTVAASIPAPVAVSKPFGSYRFSITESGGKLLAVRKLVVRKGDYPADMFGEYEAWIDQISGSKHSKVVLKNK